MFLAKTSDPQRALRNLLDRDAMFTDWLHKETTRLALPVITVDTTLTEDDLAELVAEAFGLSQRDESADARRDDRRPVRHLLASE
jgi:hypothetical protein